MDPSRICGVCLPYGVLFLLARTICSGFEHTFRFSSVFAFADSSWGAFFELDSDWGQVDEVLIASGLS